MKKLLTIILLTLLVNMLYSQTPVRERINFDTDWKFAFGHPYDVTKDFGHATSYFSYITKAGYGDGPAAASFDDRAWRKLDLPHDWAVEVPFDAKGSHSHGYKAIGRNFPENSVGWYRKTFYVDKSDLGKQFFIDFDGVSRDSKVWVNGFYVGNEPSGYQSFSYNITDVLNYGGENTISVRADVTLEEGWYYEGAGIYRHVWLTKTNPIYIPKDGTFVYSKVDDNKAFITTETNIVNKTNKPVEFYLRYKIVDEAGREKSFFTAEKSSIGAINENVYSDNISVMNPLLWSVDEPNMYTLVTQLHVNDEIVDEYKTPFGIRTIKFDPDKGFFLNGKHVKLQGTNNHQDHAGVGVAIPDELQKYRLLQLKSFGCNAYRCSHNPPMPELLDLCDKLGILVIDENRLMGTTDNDLHQLERVIRRDRNHPSVIVWSVGNEEWAIEGNEKGARIALTMQNYAKFCDPTRPVTAAISGGRNGGILTTIEIMGSNYLAHGNTDEHHKKYPNQPFIGTEEGSTFATRGIYFEDKEKQYLPAYDLKPRANWYSIEDCWKHYSERDYLAGMFIWTGFDYRGESTPYNWPSVTSYFGMLDLCGFPKDNAWYLKSWWQNEPVLHILPHWNWKGKENQPIDVWVYSNCQQVELFLNGKRLGKKEMQKNSHLEWKVNYKPGTLKAVGYMNGKAILTQEQKTTAEPASIVLQANKNKLKADKQDVSVITVQVLDKNKLTVPTANNDISFSISGPGKIIGVGNGDPTSHENEKFIDNHLVINIPDVKLTNAKDETVKNLISGTDTSAFRFYVVKFKIDAKIEENTSIKWFLRNIASEQKIYINGNLVSDKISDNTEFSEYTIDNKLVKQGENQIIMIGKPLKKKNEWDVPNQQPGTIQMITLGGKWNRKLFNGLAQIIVQSTGEEGEIVLKASSVGLKESEIKILVSNSTLIH
jgi:beta-galactosidase